MIQKARGRDQGPKTRLNNELIVEACKLLHEDIYFAGFGPYVSPIWPSVFSYFLIFFFS